MRNVNLIAGIVTTVLSSMGSAAMAQGPQAKPDAVNLESSFKGVVVTANSVGLTAKGEFNLPSPPATKAPGSSKSKSSSRSVHFSIKDAKITRGWHPCEAKTSKRARPSP